MGGGGGAFTAIYTFMSKLGSLNTDQTHITLVHVIIDTSIHTCTCIHSTHAHTLMALGLCASPPPPPLSLLTTLSSLMEWLLPLSLLAFLDLLLTELRGRTASLELDTTAARGAFWYLPRPLTSNLCLLLLRLRVLLVVVI